MRYPWLMPFAVCCSLVGCAAFDGVAPRDIDLSDFPAPDGAGSRSMESMDGMNRSKPRESAGASNEPVAQPRRAEPVALRNPRPDGPNMDVYKSSGCYAALKSVAADDAIAPHTRALAGEVLKCDSANGHYDLRHAPCPLFASADDDRRVDVAIQELRGAASACNQPPA